MNTPRRYYRMLTDVHVPGRWHVESPLDASGDRSVPFALLKDGTLHITTEPFLPVSHPGLALDFTETEVGLVVISQRLLSLYERLGLRVDCQFIPCRVEGQAERYVLLHTLRIIKCVDEPRCKVVAYDNDGSGEYSNIRGLKIDPTKVGDANIFRPWGWKVALIVSERVKQAMEEEGLTGARFTEV